MAVSSSFSDISDAISITNNVSNSITSLSDIISDVSSTTNFAGVGASSQFDSTQADERLYMISPRSSKASYSTTASTEYISDRGTITYVRLLTNNPSDLQSRVDGKVDVSNELNELVSDTGYSKFFLNGVQFSLDEKAQITPTFGDGEVVYYFGRAPVTMNLSGIIFDHLQGDWFSKFLTLHQGVLRGTKLAKNFELLEFVFPNMKVKATIANVSFSQDSVREQEIQFTMSIIVKDLTPISVPDITGQALVNGVGELIDWSIGKEGVGGWGYNLSIGSLGGGITDTWAGDLIEGMGDITDSITDTIDGVMGSLTDFRSSIFSPVYGIVSSLTKVVKALSGDIQQIISSFTNPINKIIASSMSFATGAVGLANIIESGVNDTLGLVSRTVTNYNNTLHALDNAAGVISRLPESISDIAKRHFKTGRVKASAALLSSGKKRKKSKAALLNSGVPYTPQNSYVIK